MLVEMKPVFKCGSGKSRVSAGAIWSSQSNMVELAWTLGQRYGII